MKASVITAIAASAMVSASYSEAPAHTTSTVYATSVYTTKGAVTTDYVSLYETICPVTETEKKTYPATTYPAQETYPAKDTTSSYPAKETYPPKEITSTAYITKEYTITSCKPEVTNCPVGSKTYSVETSTYTGPAVTYPPKETSPPKSYVTTECETKTYTEGGSKSYETKTYVKTYPVLSTLSPPPSKPAETYPAGGHPTKSIVTVYPSKSGGGNGNSGYPSSKPAVPSYPAGTGVVTYPGAANPTGGYPAKNTSTPYVAVTGGAAGLKVGGLLTAAGLFAALF